MISHILGEPLWLQAWVGWLVIVNTASLLFSARVEARWVLAAWLCNLVFMSALYEWNGYNRLLGLSHVVWWTPLLVYLFRRRELVPRAGAFGRWIRILVLSDAASLVIDYVDVLRYALGDRT